MSFDPRNKQHKARLYQLLRAVAREMPGMSVEKLLDVVQGKKIDRSIDYTENMRRGEYATSLAELIHHWLSEHHRPLVHRLAPELFPRPYAADWFEYAERYASRSTLRLIDL